MRSVEKVGRVERVEREGEGSSRRRGEKVEKSGVASALVLT